MSASLRTATVGELRHGLTGRRRERLRRGLAEAGLDAVLVTSPANVDYAVGYRSVAGAVHGTSSLGAILTEERLLVAGPVAESAPLFDTGFPEEDFLAFGRFFFESEGGRARATRIVEEHDGQVAALVAAVRRAGLASATIGIEAGGTTAETAAALAAALPDVRWRDASGWLVARRARKLPAEVELLRRSANAVEDGILAALDALTPGATERELADIVGATMSGAGLEPRFIVVTSGPRSALADAYASDRPIAPGDLVRFDVGGMLGGYWSDIGRTAVLGEPTERQRRYYAALLRGEEAQLELARPGVTGGELFDRAVAVVEASGGPSPYRRQHCGHGIGLTTYESVIVRPGEVGVLEAGMVFCFETPYYELGWGGMMIEDALVVTDDGCRRLTERARGLTEVPA